MEVGLYDPSRQQFIREDGSWSPFESIVHSFWWCLVTMTTVGYGDDYPVTPAGQLVAAATMFTGLVVLSLPITIIGANFDDEYRDNQRRKEIENRAEQARKQHDANAAKQDQETATSTRENPNDPGWLIKQLVQDTHDMLLHDIDLLMKKSEDDLKNRMMSILEAAAKKQQKE